MKSAKRYSAYFLPCARPSRMTKAVAEIQNAGIVWSHAGSIRRTKIDCGSEDKWRAVGLEKVGERKG